jgi:hypoxanthine phosphoribosyltransferase
VTTTSRTGSETSRRRRRRNEAAAAAALTGTLAQRPRLTSAPAPEPPFVPDGPAIATAPPDPAPVDDVRHPHPVFAHASEAEMARILDFYQVRWEYEPHTFPILWNLEGSVVESFAPDFWLPDLGLYLEMTTLRQKLVRKKNRKLRRVLELYPDLKVKLFYARDFRALMLKFGKLALVDELSGTSGQVIPERPAAALPATPTTEETDP